MKKKIIPNSFNSKSASVMTLIGIGGVIVTSILSGRSTVKALDIMNDKYYDDFENSRSIVRKKVLKAYLPAIISGASTIFCIACSNYISKKHQANLITALASSSALLNNYRETLKILPEGELVKSKIANSIAELSNIPDKSIENEILYFDEYSQRFFWSTETEVCKAMYRFNRNFLLAYGERSISDFYDLLGLDEKENLAYESFGYNSDYMEISGLRPWIDWTFRKKSLEDGTEYISMDFIWEPLFEYWEDPEEQLEKEVGYCNF